MSAPTFRTRIAELVLRHTRLHDGSIDPTRPLRELGLDSMSAVNLLLDIEATFGITFPDELLTGEVFRTVESLADSVERLVEGVGPT